MDGTTPEAFSLDDYSEEGIQQAKDIASLGGKAFGSEDLENYLKLLFPGKVSKPTVREEPSSCTDVQDQDIDDVWSQDSQDRETSQPQQDFANDRDDIHHSVREENSAEAQPIAQPAAPQTAAEAVQEAVDRNSDQDPLNPVCPGYIINSSVANCRDIRTDKEFHCIGLLNFLMRKHGYTYMTNEQLAKWLRMEKRESVRHLLARLAKRGLIFNTGNQRNKTRWVVREDLCDPKRGER